MAVGPQGVVTFVGTRKNKVWAVTDRDRDRVADEVKEFAPSLDFKVPNGSVLLQATAFCSSPSTTAFSSFPAAEFFYESPDVAVGEVAPQGKLIPATEESRSTTAPGSAGSGRTTSSTSPSASPSTCRLRRSASSSPSTASAASSAWTATARTARSMQAASATRSGMDFNPANGELWFTDNQVDGMGDDTPPGEINRITGPGQNFGFPWYGGGDGTHRRVPGRAAAGRRGRSRRSSSRRMPPTSA